MKHYKKITFPGCKFYYLSDVLNLIYCEPTGTEDDFCRVATVHKPNLRTGTGFSLSAGTKLNSKIVDTFLSILAPHWANDEDVKSVIKYKSLEEFLDYERKFFPDLLVEDFNLE